MGSATVLKIKRAEPPLQATASVLIVCEASFVSRDQSDQKSAFSHQLSVPVSAISSSPSPSAESTF